MVIPFFSWTHFSIGPLTFQVWGLFVALGFLVGTWVASHRAAVRGLSGKILWDMLGWILLVALVVGRLFHVVFYDWAFYAGRPLEILKIWEGGLSVYGGFVGAVLAGAWFLRRRRVPVWTYAEAAVFGLPLGLAVGRLGCFFIHDHPGRPTSFFLGARFPDGVTRYDLGLMESVLMVFLAALFFFFGKKKQPLPVFFLVVFSIVYGLGRFFLDFLRAVEGPIVDARVLGLTPAQYFSFLLFLFGLALWLGTKKAGKPTLLFWK